MKDEALNAAHAVVDVTGALICVTLHKKQAQAIAKRIGHSFGYRPATEDDVAELGRRVDDDLA